MYMIIRNYRNSARKNKIVRTCLTLEQAQEHCSDPATRVENVWFDGYTEQLYVIRSAKTWRIVKRGLTYARAESMRIEMSYRYNKQRYTITPMEQL